MAPASETETPSYQLTSTRRFSAPRNRQTDGLRVGGVDPFHCLVPGDSRGRFPSLLPLKQMAGKAKGGSSQVIESAAALLRVQVAIEQ